MSTRIAFWGGGIVAGPHGRAIKATPSARFAGVYDPNAEQARSIAGINNGRVFSKPDELLTSPHVDAVAVLSPNHTHVEVALACLAAGKHVLIEKPVAESREELAALKRAADVRGLICMPAHNYIYHPNVTRMKRFVEERAYGRIASMWVMYNIFHSEELAKRYGGVLREVCVHHAYSVVYLLGRPKSVSAVSSVVHYEKLTCEDVVNLVCRMENGSLANLWCSFAASDSTSDPWTVVYKILGDKGGAVHSWNGAVFEDPRGPGWGFPDYIESFAREVEFFVDRAIAHGEAPLSGLQEAADALSIIEAAEQSIRNGGRETEIVYESL